MRHGNGGAMNRQTPRADIFSRFLRLHVKQFIYIAAGGWESSIGLRYITRQVESGFGKSRSRGASSSFCVLCTPEINVIAGYNWKCIDIKDRGRTDREQSPLPTKKKGEALNWCARFRAMESPQRSGPRRDNKSAPRAVDEVIFSSPFRSSFSPITRVGENLNRCQGGGQ